MGKKLLLAFTMALFIVASANLFLNISAMHAAPTAAITGNVSLIVASPAQPPQPPGPGPGPAPGLGGLGGAAPSGLEVNVITPTTVDIVGTSLPPGTYNADTSNATGLGVSGVSFGLTQGASFKIIIEKVSKPADVDTKETNFQYLDVSITGTPPENIKDIRFTIKVDKNWVAMNRIDKSTVVLSFWDNGWKELSMTGAGEDSVYLYYSVSVPGVGLYAISGVKSPLVAIPMPMLPALQINVLIAELNLLIMVYPLLFAMIIIALILFFLLIMFGRKIRDKIRRMEIIETLERLLTGRKRLKGRHP